MSDPPRVHLLVDDPRRATALEKSLISAGFSVVVPRDAAAARLAVTHTLPDDGTVFLLAARVRDTDSGPLVDAPPIIAALRRLAPRVPIVVLEGNAVDESEVLHPACFRAGADAYLTNPHSDEVIILQIRALLGFAERLRSGSLGEAFVPSVAGSAVVEAARSAARVEERTYGLAPTKTAVFAKDYLGRDSDAAISEAPPTREFDAPIPLAALATPVAPPMDLETMKRASLPSIPPPGGVPRLSDPPSEASLSLDVDLSEFDGEDSTSVLSSRELEDYPLSVPIARDSLLPETELRELPAVTKTAQEPTKGRESVPPDPKKLDEGW